ncbi:MAG: GNAT family N-acetyltransferase [Clostridia bacterium]|nr:GNAT family N-acetyltransferase [Clostridia bacterium]
MKIRLQSKKSMLEQEEFEVKIIYDQAENYYTINAYNTHGEVVSFATLKPNYSPRQMWLYKISTLENYQHKGYATAVLKVMEYLSIQLRFNCIEGKYFPENEHAKTFYDKHGYTVYKDGYESYVTKVLDYEEIKQNIEPNILNYQIERTRDEGRC